MLLNIVNIRFLDPNIQYLFCNYNMQYTKKIRGDWFRDKNPLILKIEKIFKI